MSAPRPPVEAVIFDLGGVITIDPYALFEDYARSLGITMAAFGTVFRHGDPVLAQMERGDIPMMAHLDYVARSVGSANGVTIDVDALAQVIRACMTPREEMVLLIPRIRRHNKVAILTNNTADLAEHWRGQLPADFVDVIVESFAERMRKPDREIYALAAERLGCAMEACVFVDDQPANVEAARAFGMGGVTFKDPAQCERDLVALGVRL